jgi:hypothetical protein
VEFLNNNEPESVKLGRVSSFQVLPTQFTYVFLSKLFVQKNIAIDCFFLRLLKIHIKR